MDAPAWLTGGRQEITGHTLYEYQQELTYEACSITYDHGIAFVEAPTGSGKTEIGCHLAEALSETFSRVIPRSPVHGVARKNAAVIAPPKVISSWEKHSTNSLEAIPNTSLSKKRLRGAGDDSKSGLRLDQFGVLIIDESHTVTPGFEQASQMAAAVELAPPSWNVCLSATLLGNRDVDWLAHMQEKRASIFMTPDYIQAMGELFEREMQSSPDIFDQKAPLAVLSEPETALSRQARTELSELISPFLARRQRRCIGEDEDRSKHSYPKLANHGRPNTYREAVVDGWLIDHEPPIRFQTALSKAGILFEAGENVEVMDSKTGEVENTIAPDEMDFQVESFNRKVITQPFNQVVAEELAKHIDPSLDGKTLVFAATDAQRRKKRAQGHPAYRRA